MHAHCFSKEKIYKSLTKWQNSKKALVNTVTAGDAEKVFYATIEWE